MARLYLILSVLVLAPLLQSCSSMPATLAVYGVKALLSVKHSNESAYGYYQLGRYYQAQNQLDAAQIAYKKSLSVDNGFYEAINALGIVYSMQGKSELAIEHFRSALAQSPKSAHLHNNLGRAYYSQHKYQEAVNALESAAELDPHNYTTLHNLGLAYEGAGHREKSEQSFRAAQTLRGRDALAVSRALLGQPSATSRQQAGAAPSAANEPLPAVASPGGIFSRALAASPNTRSSIGTNTNRAGNSVAEVILGRSDADATIVLINPNVYELRAPRVSTQTPSVPSPRPLQQSSALDERLFRLEVSNGNAIPGLARKVGEQLKRSGVNVARLTNQVPYRQRVTEIQYREGYTDEAAKLASTLQQQVIVVHAKALRPDIHVRLVLGKDIPDHVALFKLESVDDRRPMALAAQVP